MKSKILAIASMLVVVALFAMSTDSLAAKHRHHYRHHYRTHWQSAATHRQKTKNNWRNTAIASGAAGVLGLATHNGTLTTLGVAGAGYSAYRYEQDRKSQNRIQHRKHHRKHRKTH